MLSLKIIFHGRVQGVGFRYATKEIALGFDVIGTVKNLPNSTVELIITGDDEEVEEFLTEIIEESNLASHITEVERKEVSPYEGKGFTIAK